MISIKKKPCKRDLFYTVFFDQKTWSIFRKRELTCTTWWEDLLTCRMSRMGARHMGGYHIGFVLGHFGLCWDILGHVGQELGPYWACLGPFWAMLGHFGPCWNHIGLILGHFGLFSDLCRPLFWTRAFQRRWLFVHASVCKKHQKYQEKYTKNTKKNTICGLCCWWFLLLFFGCFCFFLGACCS